jgi:hypothetical protein
MILEADFEPVDLTTAVFRLTGRMILGTLPGHRITFSVPSSAVPQVLYS